MKDKLLIIAGPTASGKTEISIKLANRLNGEIISADSMQIYKHMNIGSAKIKKSEMHGIVHHMIDIIEPYENYTAAQFKKQSVKIIKGIISRGHLPMIVGGTGLYIDSIIMNYNFTDACKDENYRKYLEELAKSKGRIYVHEMLKDVDRDSYIKIHPNNLKRVVRALEVYKVTGRPISEYNSNENKYDVPYDVYYYILTMNRKKLYEKINRRVDIMIENGLVDEVLRLKKMGYNKGMQSMQGIGYKEMLMYLEGEITFDMAVDMIKQGTRNYAKRQLTWFRRDKRAVWINKDNYVNDDEIVKEIITNMIN